MKQKEILILSDDELKDKLDAFQKNLHDLKLTHVVSPLAVSYTHLTLPTTCCV